MATLTGSTIAGTYDQLIKREDSYNAAGNLIELMNDSGTMVTTALYLDAANKEVGINTGATVDAQLHVQNSGNTDTSVKIECAYDHSSADTILQNTVANTSASNYIYFGDSGSATIGSIRYDHSTNIMSFASGSGVLEITSGTDDLPHLQITNTSTSQQNGGALIFRNADTNTNLGDNLEIGQMIFQGYNITGSDWESAAMILCRKYGATGGNNDMGGELAFYTTPDGSATLAQRMCILNGGNVGIGETNPSSAQFQVKGADGVDNKWAGWFQNADTDNPEGIEVFFSGATFTADVSDDRFIDCSDDTNTAFAVYSDGGVVTVLGETHSDIRIKENIIDATSKLDEINQLRVRNFNLKGKNSKYVGFIADELEEVFPSVVRTRKAKWAGVEYDALKNICTDALVPMLVKAVQELSAKVTALENA